MVKDYDYYESLVESNKLEIEKYQQDIERNSIDPSEKELIRDKIEFLKKQCNSLSSLASYNKELKSVKNSNELSGKTRKNKISELKNNINSERKQLREAGRFSKILSSLVGQVDKHITNFFYKSDLIYNYRCLVMKSRYKNKFRYLSIRLALSALMIIMGSLNAVGLFTLIGIVGASTSIFNVARAIANPEFNVIVRDKKIEKGSYINNIKKAVYKYSKTNNLSKFIKNNISKHTSDFENNDVYEYIDDSVKSDSTIEKEDILENTDNFVKNDNSESYGTNRIFGFNNSQEQIEVFSLISKIDIDNLDKDLVEKCFSMYEKLNDMEKSQLGKAKSILFSAMDKIKNAQVSNAVNSNSFGFNFDQDSFKRVKNLKDKIDSLNLNSINVRLIGECQELYSSLTENEKKYIDVPTLEKLKSACYEYVMQKENKTFEEVAPKESVTYDKIVKAVIYDYVDSSKSILDRHILCTIIDGNSRHCEQLSGQALCDDVDICSITSKEYIKQIISKGLKKRYSLLNDPKIVYSKDVIMEKEKLNGK